MKRWTWEKHFAPALLSFCLGLILLAHAACLPIRPPQERVINIPFAELFSQPAKGLEDGLVVVSDIEGQGTGFVIGYNAKSVFILTAAHVVSSKVGLTAAGTVAVLETYNEESDYALLSVPNPGGPIKFFPLGAAVQDEPVMAIGFYFDGDGGPVLLRMQGHIAALDPESHTIAANTGIHSGMSGGPLVNTAGIAVGINSRSPGFGRGPNPTVGLFARTDEIRDFLRTKGWRI